jgi:hypothetical protein
MIEIRDDPCPRRARPPARTASWSGGIRACAAATKRDTAATTPADAGTRCSSPARARALPSPRGRGSPPGHRDLPRAVPPAPPRLNGAVPTQHHRRPAARGRAAQQVADAHPEDERADHHSRRDRDHRSGRRCTLRALSATRRSGHGHGKCGVPVPGVPHAVHRPRASGTCSRTSTATTSGMAARATASSDGVGFTVVSVRMSTRSSEGNAQGKPGQPGAHPTGGGNRGQPRSRPP